MHKLLTALLFIGLTCYANQSTGQSILYNPSLTNKPIGAPPTLLKRIDYAASFPANIVHSISKFINSIFQDTQGNYWFASNGAGVYLFDGKTLIQFTTKDGLSDNQVFTIQEDTQHNIWFLTVGGISRFDGKTLTKFPEKYTTQVLHGNPLSIEPTDMWFGYGSGAYQYNGHSFFYMPLSPSHPGANAQAPDARKLNAYSIYCSLKDKKGNLWFGTQAQGVCRYDGTAFTWFTEKRLGGPAVRALFEDSRGNVWFGNNGGGLFRYDGKTLSNFTEEKGLSNPEFLKTGKPMQGTMARVWTVNEDNSGNIWIGTYDSGLWRYNGKDLLNYTTKDGLTSNAITTIYKDSEGVLWIGTDGAGVCIFNGILFSTPSFRP